jgi:hypothetical protein
MTVSLINNVRLEGGWSVSGHVSYQVISDTADTLAARGLRAVTFNLPLLLASEAAARQGGHHPLREALERIRNRRRGG